MKDKTILIIFYLSIFLILFQLSYQWGLRYWVQTENKKVKVYDTFQSCLDKCPTKDCYSVNDYHKEAKTALTNLGHNFNKNATTETICYTVNNTINYNEWAHPDSKYFKVEEAIHHTFQYEDICNSFCQPLYESGCTITYTGWKCYKATAPIFTVPKNKTESDFKLPEKFTISTQGDDGEQGDCLVFQPDERIKFTGCEKTSNFTFYTKHLDANNYLILHDDPKSNGTKYAMTYTRNIDVLKFRKVEENYYKQVWTIDSICHGKYRFLPYNIPSLCARIDYLRKCDDDKKEIGDLQIYDITELK